LTKTVSCWTPFLFAAADFEVPSAVADVHNIGSEIFRLRVQGQGLVNGPCTGQLQVFKQQKRERGISELFIYMETLRNDLLSTLISLCCQLKSNPYWPWWLVNRDI
jgi:hypothetical protein